MDWKEEFLKCKKSLTYFARTYIRVNNEPMSEESLQQLDVIDKAIRSGYELKISRARGGARQIILYKP